MNDIVDELDGNLVLNLIWTHYNDKTG